jgi:WD40 repeat protein
MLRGHDASATTVAWRPGSAPVLATGGRDATVKLWRPANGTAGKPMRPAASFDTDGPVTAVAWLDPRRLAVATGTGRLHVVDTGLS